ncbi:putative glucan 1,3-beta-glucosidase [Amylocarpus encephaloides]|uniref:glucan 1,3-beta-glucosidase n=1 Tax=Amylocarpus encephaloides TaxID=45428 RepID=A0A9P8C511_9HELO|nr:putative glucan 1,3-beta-glucosidase [Amylocarpus encephaloides]
MLSFIPTSIHALSKEVTFQEALSGIFGSISLATWIFLLEDDSEESKPWVKNTFSILAVIAVGVAGWAIAWQSGVWVPSPVEDAPVANAEGAIGARILGYISAVCYLGARIPQIYKNYKDKSCEATLLLAVLPLLASAAGSLGFALGAKNADGTCKSSSDYTADFKVLSPHSKVVRTYAASQCNTAQAILPAAKSAGAKVILGIWPDVEESFDADKAAIVKYAPQYKDQVYAITVGSETMYRGNFTGEELLVKIADVKKATGGAFKVGTADSWNKYQDGTADPLIKGGADILLINAFSYWQGQTIANSTNSFFDDIMQAFGHIQAKAGSTTTGPELWVGETGWPSDGHTYQSAVPGVKNAEAYWKSAICGILAWGVNVFAFEAFDEPWKPLSVGQDGSVADETHWGVWNSDRSEKFSVSC